MNGCCVDKKYGKGCTEDTCMSLPESLDCSCCAFFEHCKRIYGVKADHVTCDFFPRRFRQRTQALKPD